MVRPDKKASKKQKKTGVDFKKIKRKLGRKLPPPKNATNIEIKSKAIVLPEQSVASERAGLAVSKKGLTLKELLQQTSHHNGKIRKDALMGIKDLLLRYPEELSLHRLAIIEKLRERISDDDRGVRETLYELLKLVIFPGSKEDTSGPFISLIMAYISNAMTHLAVDIRLMALTFFDLVVQHYPSSFLPYAEEVLRNYADVLGMNLIYLQDRRKLKNALVGLVRCLLLLPSDNRKNGSSYDNSTNERGTLLRFEKESPKEHTDLSFILETLDGLLLVLVNCFHELTPSVRVMSEVDSQSFDCMSCVLQSIDLVVKFFIYEIEKPRTGSKDFVPCTDKGDDAVVWGKATIPLMRRKMLDVFPLSPAHHPTEKDEERCHVLNVGIAGIFLNLTESIEAPANLMEKFLEFIENVLSGQILCHARSSRSVRDKHLVLLLPFIPRLVLEVESNWKLRLLQAFTEAFVGCKPNSSLKLACLTAIEKILLPSHRNVSLFVDTIDRDVLGYLCALIRELPVLLVSLGIKQPSFSKVVLLLLLRLGQHAPVHPALAWEYDNMQHSLTKFYDLFSDEAKDQGVINYGPFINLPRDCQELAVCSLYYFSCLDPLMLRSIASCCLCESLESLILFRIIEVLHSSYKAGHIQIADHISFLITILARFRVVPEKFDHVMEDNGKVSNRGTFKAVTNEVCSCLSQMGDDTLILEMLQKILVSQMSLDIPLDNKQAMLKLLAMLQFRPSGLPEESINIFGNSILQYLIDAASYIPENNGDESIRSFLKSICQYYLIPCFILFDRSTRLISLVLNLMASLIAGSNSLLPSNDDTVCAREQSRRISAITSILLFMHKEVKLQKILSSHKAEIKVILQNLHSVQFSNERNMSLEERHKIKLALARLETATGLQSSDDFEKVSGVE